VGKFLSVVCALLMAGCTSVGKHTKEIHDYNWDTPITQNLCIMKDPTVSADRVQQCNLAIKEEAALYNIQVNIPMEVEYERPAYFFKGLQNDMEGRYLPRQCDDILYYVGRNWFDFIWDVAGFKYPLPSIYGMVDYTMTRGYAFVERKGPGHFIADKIANERRYGACASAVHEWYHLVSCGHGFTKNECYKQIDALRQATTEDFMPGYDYYRDEFIMSREEVDKIWGVVNPEGYSDK